MPPIPGAARYSGVMEVWLTNHGGQNATLRILDGLVDRNARAIKEGKLPRLTPAIDASGTVRGALSRMSYVEEPVWYDGLESMRRGRVNARVLAAWLAAERRLDGRETRLGINDGIAVAQVGEAGVGGTTSWRCQDVSRAFGRMSTHGPGLVGAIPQDPDRGRVVECLYLGLDDDKALPVREIGDRIADHNARRILSQGLPRLYESGVVYKTEGSPERWWDAEEILANGHDDCEGLAAYRAGELLADDVVRDARVWTRLIQKPPDANGVRRGGRIFHAMTQIRTKDGRLIYDDPSVTLGMPVPNWYRDFAAQRRAAGQPL